MTEPTPDPFGEFAVSAMTVHEMFSAYVAAGFTRDEALYLVASVLTAGVKRGAT